MREICSSGSVEGVPSNGHSYSDSDSVSEISSFRWTSFTEAGHTCFAFPWLPSSQHWEPPVKPGRFSQAFGERDVQSSETRAPSQIAQAMRSDSRYAARRRRSPQLSVLTTGRRVDSAARMYLPIRGVFAPVVADVVARSIILRN